MDLTNDVLVSGAIFVLGLLGLWVAHHIYQKKRKQQPLVCPIRFDCNTVVNSDYSRFLGIPVEILGMIYYGIIALAYLLILIIPALWSPTMLVLLTGVSLVAFIFSLYLIWVQIFALKKGCSWCFVSAAISTVIFFLALFTHGFAG